uniref:Putative secreted protein n=1 Tax=Anopheles triannulatus TaxID=58253 RepID=A0A2M4B143_9DIPT
MESFKLFLRFRLCRCTVQAVGSVDRFHVWPLEYDIVHQLLVRGVWIRCEQSHRLVALQHLQIGVRLILDLLHLVRRCVDTQESLDCVQHFCFPRQPQPGHSKCAPTS